MWITLSRNALSMHFEITREGLISLVRAIKSKPERKLILDECYQSLLNDCKYSDKQIMFEFKFDYAMYSTSIRGKSTFPVSLHIK